MTAKSRAVLSLLIGCRSANRQLDLCQPIVRAFLVPDSIDIAFSCQTGWLVTVFLCIFHDKGIRFSDAVIRPFMVDAQYFCLRDIPEPDDIILNAPGCYSLVMPDLDIMLFVFAVRVLTEFIFRFRTA